MSNLKICRICLNVNVRGYNSDTNNLSQYYEEVMAMQIQDGDELPKWFCYECSTLLHKFHKFRDKCFNGTKVLKQILWKGKLTYESVSLINRYSHNLHMPLSLTVPNKYVKTYKFKYHHHPKKSIEVEQVIVHCPQEEFAKDSLQEVSVFDNVPEPAIDINKVSEDIYVKLERVPIANTVDIDDDCLDTDIHHSDDELVEPVKQETVPNGDERVNHIDEQIKQKETVSSDDESILLNLLKKAINDDNNLLVIDRKKTKERNKKPKKFTQRKKDPFSPDLWQKISLTEEQAMEEFQKRQYSSKYVKANFKCKSCFKGFSRVDMLERHLKERHDESVSFKCRFCNMGFNLKYLLKRHMAGHYSIYQCLLCDMKFNLENSAAFHANYHSGDIRKCKYCGQGFKHVSTYYSHVRTAHRSAHVCRVCGASFVSPSGLAQHARISHYDNNQQDIKDTSEGVYCEKCDVTFVSQSAFVTHLANSNMHTDISDNKAKFKDGVTRRGAMTACRPRANRKPTTCIHCGEHFSTQAACMKHHLATHPRKTFFASDKRHICEICGASLASVSIASHMNKHTREHLFSCEICGMQFTSKSSYHRHHVTHTGERRYACPLCDKRFTQKGSMKLHYNTFHLKQPYPKRIRKKKTDEVPLVESCRREIDDGEPINANRWR